MRHYGRICPRCGAFLDPGESCDCEREKEAAWQQKSTYSTAVQNGLKPARGKSEALTHPLVSE